MKRFILFAITFLLIFPAIFCRDFSVVEAEKAFDYALDKDGKLVVVIDPGHGGSNEGAKYYGTKEKYETIVIAKAMKEELEKYDGVAVYLTHDDPEKNIEIADRINYAAAKNADFYFSIHLNAKANHDGYGSEVWIPFKNTDYNHEAYKFSAILLPKFEEMGIFCRGIKQKSETSKSEEYYGVMRFANKKKFASCIIEHCHMDNEVDEKFWHSESALKALGVADATAAAEYFALSSSKLGVSYTDRVLPECPYTDAFYDEDPTRPEECSIEFVSNNADGSFTLTLRTHDEQTPVLFYALSRDGGLTFEAPVAIPGADALKMYNPPEVNIVVPAVEADDQLMVKVYNKYDTTRLSNIISADLCLHRAEEKVVPYVENRIEQLQKKRHMITAVIILSSVLAVLVSLLVILSLVKKYKRYKKRLRKKHNRM